MTAVPIIPVKDAMNTRKKTHASQSPSRAHRNMSNCTRNNLPYQSPVKKKAEWLLGEELYTVVGSDLHCEDAIEYITECKLKERQMGLIKNLLQSNL